MSEQKIKVADLPQEEKEKMLNEAKELNIRNFTDLWNVETLQKKIDEAKAKLAQNQQDNADGEQNTAADEQTQNDGEQNAATDEQTQNDNKETPAENKQNADAPAATETPAEIKETPAETQQAPKVDKGDGQAYAQEKKPKPPVVKICHICRSKVVNGKCTGCGFTLK